MAIPIARAKEWPFFGAAFDYSKNYQYAFN
jgi:hypothetical protein